MAKRVKLEPAFSPFMPVREVLHKEESFKCLVFYLKSAQSIDLHRSPRRVIIIVLEGEGEFFVGSKDKIERLKKGEVIIYEPEEPHGFRAIEDMVVMALVV